MNQLPLALEGAWKVLAAGLLLGAGIPLMFAFAVRSLAYANGAGKAGAPRHPIGKVVAAACFTVILLGVGLGLTQIIATGFGKSVSYEHIYPTIVSKS